MLLRKWLLSVLLILTAAALTGCWNRKELNEISIATAFGFDKDSEQYNVSVQLINATEISASNSGGGRVPVITVQKSKGRTIFESVRAMTTTTPRKIYSSHLRILVIGEDLAREGIGKVLDSLSRDHELRTDFYIIVAKGGSASDVLKILTPLEKLPTDKMFSSLKASQKSWGVTAKVDLHQLIYDLVDQGKDPVLSGIRIIGDVKEGESRANLSSASPGTMLKYESLAVFRKDKLAGWLNARQSKGYNYIRGNISSTIIRLPCPKGDDLAVELIHASHKIKAKIVNGKPEIQVTVRAEGNVGEVECAMDLGTNEAIALLEKELNGEIKATMESAIARAKGYKADIFGFGDAVHRADYRLWNRLKDHWTDEFVRLPVHITVKADIRRTGSVVESFLERMEEEE
ncbi:Ger(x)C family spore germination protein [Paenibacillus sacheonensis]|uniref:Ger(X)C family spore germination protein n=1 Tax=Paenibacillus sacheonensis TaxID=742054 RepID=A0A7X4YU80_9BACL|nr:Ger(x)C family spore germination protein [Paenibacillus sacheonensis]MBM7568896.1 spore germination protein KC [Paenibacillus sacheonensis]NBC72598.1 Ger(x)C family spore germination protein [Paenibacillus sacheonensis]